MHLQYTISTPDYFEWNMLIGGIQIRVLKSQVPSWFHRKMQTFVLGIKWTKVK